MSMHMYACTYTRVRYILIAQDYVYSCMLRIMSIWLVIQMHTNICATYFDRLAWEEHMHIYIYIYSVVTPYVHKDIRAQMRTHLAKNKLLHVMERMFRLSKTARYHFLAHVCRMFKFIHMKIYKRIHTCTWDVTLYLVCMHPYTVFTNMLTLAHIHIHVYIYTHMSLCVCMKWSNMYLYISMCIAKVRKSQSHSLYVHFQVKIHR